MSFPWQITGKRGVVCVALAEGSSCLSITIHDRSIVLDSTAAKTMRRALDLFVAGADPPLSRFIASCLRVAPGARVQATALYQVYRAWAKASGEQIVSQNMFGRDMHARGVISRNYHVNYWINVELTNSAKDFVDGSV